MKKSAFLALSVVVIVCSLVDQAHVRAQAGASVVISEFRTRGPLGGNEFVELFNASAAPVDISGWKISGSNNAGTTVTCTATDTLTSGNVQKVR